MRNHPRPGVLPPFVVELLHNPEHLMFPVSVNAPDIKPTGDISPFIPPSYDKILCAVPHSDKDGNQLFREVNALS